MPPNMELIADHLIQKTQARYALSLLKSIEKWYLTKTSQKFTILELGSDTGHFLVELINLLQKKFDVDAKEITIVSIEPNVAVHATLKNNLEKLMGRRWPLFCFQHPQLYSKQSLPQLFTHSFKVESLSISSTFNGYPLSVITSFLKLDFLTKLFKCIYSNSS